MQRTDTVIIGAGQAGLAMSHCLTRLGLDHVVLERGQVAERWRRSSWDSLRLLTPNWMSRLPGASYVGDDPDGFMRGGELVERLDAYAASFAAPVLGDTPVESVQVVDGGYHICTARGSWRARVVVVATGECQRPAVPAMAQHLPSDVLQITPAGYRNVSMLPPGGVLVVGASASGAQLADEIQCAGRPVTLSVGRHTRMPRRYRGHDIMTWLDLAGILDESADAVPDIERARRQPSLQLMGRTPARAVDLPALRARGVRVVGRVSGIEGRTIQCAGDLARISAQSEQKMTRLLARIDAFIATNGLHAVAGPAEVLTSGLFEAPPVRLQAGAAGIHTVIWATGYRRAYPWLYVPVLDGQGEIAHAGGITAAPGLYALGLRFMRRRKSNFIDGVGRDAEELADHIAAYLRLGRSLAA